jgi:hypothetical protein
MKSALLILFSIVITFHTHSSYCQQKKYKTECLGLYNEELQKYWPEYFPEITIDIKHFKFKNNKLRIKGKLSNSGYPLIFFMILKGINEKEQKKITISDTVFLSKSYGKSIKEVDSSGKFQVLNTSGKPIKIDASGKFKIKTKLTEGESLFIVSLGSCFTEFIPIRQFPRLPEIDK